MSMASTPPDAMSLPTDRPWRVLSRRVTIAAVLWSVLALSLGGWGVWQALQSLRHEALQATQHRLDSAQRGLQDSFQQLTVLPRALARQEGIRHYLTDHVLANSDRLNETQRTQVRNLAEVQRSVQAQSEQLTATAQDFGLGALFVTDSYGTTLADSNAHQTDNAIGRSFRGRRYYVDALDNPSGLGYQFAVSQVAVGPAFFFSSRVGPIDAPMGVVVVMQYARAFSKMLQDPGRRLFVTDEQGVIVMASELALPLQRTPLMGRGALNEEASARLYKTRPVPVDWQLERLRVRDEQVLVVREGEQRFMALSRPLDGRDLTLWALVPMQGEAALIAAGATVTTLAWLGGLGGLALMGQRIRRQAALSRAQRELARMAHALPLSVFCWRQPPDAPGEFSFVAQSAQSLLALGHDDFRTQAQKVWSLMGPDMVGPPLHPTDFQIRTPEGNRWLRCESRCVHHSDGSQVFNGYWADITERKQVEARTQAVFLNSPVAFLFFDTEHGITRCNPSALQLFGAETDQALLGLDPTRPPLSPMAALNPDAQAILSQAAHTQQAVTFEWRHTRLDGEPFDTEIVLVPFEFEQRLQYCAVIQDISARKRAELAQQAAQRAAEAATQAKSNFLANMSHEIRTPMNAIMGMTHLALMDELPAKARSYVDKAHRAATTLLQILNDVLDVSKIESGKLELESVPFQLENVVRHMAEVLGVRAEEKGLELLFTAPPEIPTALIGDPIRLGQVLINLGTNAIKFTDSGDILIGCEVQRQGPHDVLLHFWVRDSGIGMDQAQIEHLFEPFTQADSSTTRQYGGTGLGLTISRQLVELMNGRIWANSQPGRGSTFHFTARFGVQSQQTRRALLASELQGRRVMLVDDNATAREVLGDMVRRLGLHVDTADSGDAALLRMQQAVQAGQPHDILLTDWRMPDMDGITFAREALAMPPEHRPCVLLVTAFGREEATAAAQDAGVDLAGVLNKPVTPSTLFDTLSRVLGQDNTPPSALPESTRILTQARERLAGARVLLVEDQPMNQELARDLLERAGMTVITANNGQEALNRLQDDGPFDGVLMDCQMPVLDGYSATERIREQAQWQSLPVIAMTASAMATDRERVLRSGMNDHITKPLDLARMFDIMARWITPSGRADTAHLLQGVDGQTPHSGSLQHLDTTDGLARCMGNLDLYSRLLKGFARTQRDFGTFYDHASSREQAQLLTHTLKGLAGNIGARALADACEHLEQALSGGQQAAEEPALWRTRCRELQQLAVSALDQVIGEIDAMQQTGADRQDAARQALQAMTQETDGQDWDTLARLISEHDAQARDHLHELLETWPALLDEPLITPLRRALEQYDFSAAQQALTALVNGLALHGQHTPA